MSIVALFGCREMEEPVDIGVDIPMKSVTLSANMDFTDSTKASLDNTGLFAWQKGDKISVLSTDNKFYVFEITDGIGSKTASFTGQIPETAEVSDVATYPAIVSTGADNVIVSGNDMTFTMPEMYDYEDNNTNVPMVAKGDFVNAGMSFKQVGGVIRFPVNNLPRKAKFIFASSNKRVIGNYPLDLSKIGESFIEAEDKADGSSLTINYSSDVDGKPATFNVPLPVGMYDDFTISIQDESGKSLFSKEYHSEKNKIERKTLRLMKELQLETIPVSLETVYPYFTNARVLWYPQYGAEGYALFVDDNEPVMLDDLHQVNSNGLLEYSFGKFDHGTEHAIAIAKVVGNEIVEASKSVKKTFKTGEIWQIRNNVGPTHICFEYTNIAGTTGSTSSAYHVQVFDTEDTLQTPIYSFYTADMNVKNAGVYAGRKWYGMVNGNASIIPMRISVGNLQPGKDYYIRMKSVGSSEHKVSVGTEEGNTKTAISLYSKTGESRYSMLYKITTEQVHSVVNNEVLFEGFDDMALGTDYINSSATLIPIMQAAKGKYVSSLKTNYNAFLKKENKKWCVCTAQFNECGTFEEYGFASNGVITNDCSIKNWSYTGKCTPNYGFVVLGRNDIASFRTTALESATLSDIPVPCKVTFKACPVQYDPEAIYDNIRVDVYKPDASGNYIVASIGDTKKLADNREYWSNKENYKNNYSWQEVSDVVMLAKGWKLQITIPNPSNGSNAPLSGCIAIDDIQVVADASLSPVLDNLEESVADNTNYYSYGDGFFPISYWWDVPSSFASKERYEEVKEAGFTMVLHTGEIDRSFEANKQIASWCKELGMKYIGYGLGEIAAERIQNTKELRELYPDTYVGDYGWDEPVGPAAEYITNQIAEYQEAMPGCQLYVNLYPSYARADTQLQSENYGKYLDGYLSRGSCKSISVDTYPLKKNGAIRRDYFYNLDIVRAKTLEKKIPFWVITQSAASNDKNVTEPMIRWTVWVDLAFGSKGIAYFTYWQPVGYDSYKYMIARDGTRNPTYDWIKRMNSDVMTIGKTLMNCHADGVITTSYDFTLYERRFKYGPVSSISATSGAIAGCFTDVTTGAKKILVVNELPTTQSNTVTLSVDNTISSVKITKNNETSVVLPSDGNISLSVSQGEAILVEF